MHLETEQTERLLHGELTPEARDAWLQHLAGCARCRAQFDRATQEQAELLELLHSLDHAAPAIDVQQITARAQAINGGQSALVVAEAGPGWTRWAALLALAAGLAGAVYAAPALLSLWTADQPVAEQDQTAVVDFNDASGITVPTGPQLTIQFLRSQDEVATVLLTQEADVVVRALRGGASYESDATQLSVDNSAAQGGFEIRIPASAQRVEILVAGRRVFLKEGTSISSAARPSEGRYVVPLRVE